MKKKVLNRIGYCKSNVVVLNIKTEKPLENLSNCSETTYNADNSFSFIIANLSENINYNTGRT